MEEKKIEGRKKENKGLSLRHKRDKREETKSSATLASSTNEVAVGPENFKALKVLGKGSFGDVYLVERIIGPDEESEPEDLGKHFAMKILPKDKVMENNLIRYALSEKKILGSLNHPFIVRLCYAF